MNCWWLGSQLLIAGGLLAAFSLSAQPLANYDSTVQVSGTIRVGGSPQMENLLALYEQGFQKRQPNVQFANQLKSTVDAVYGIYSGRADISLLGREIWPAEQQAFEATLGRQPKVLDIATGAYDVPKATYALMIFVHAGNPISSLTMDQLESVFGAGTHRVHKWGELGARGRWARRPVHLYGFSTENDKSLIFRQLVFTQHEQWNASLHQFHNGNGLEADAGAQVVRAIANDPDAVGISNVYYSTPAVKALALATRNHPAPLAPTRENIASREYPLTRAVYMVVDPNTLRRNSAVREFLRYVCSKQGSEAVARQRDYLPLPPEIAARELRDLNGE